MTDRNRWLRGALLVLAVPNLLTGLWAVFAPHHWYDTFPGWSPHLVAAHPPFNEHLATDAGAGLLATGLLVLIAAIRFRRDVVVTAVAGYLALAVPHAIFHLVNPAPRAAMSFGQNALSTAELIVAACVGLVVLLSYRRIPA